MLKQADQEKMGWNCFRLFGKTYVVGLLFAFFIKAFILATPLEKSPNGVILELEPTVDGPLKGQ